MPKLTRKYRSACELAQRLAIALCENQETLYRIPTVSIPVDIFQRLTASKVDHSLPGIESIVTTDFRAAIARLSPSNFLLYSSKLLAGDLNQS